jgi:hypothetical protein
VRRLIGVVAVLVALLLLYLVVDLVAKGYVEGRVAQEFEDSEQLQVEDASFSIDSFPFLFRLAAYGEVSATLELEGVQDHGLTIDRFDLSVDGLRFDRVSAFAGDVEATDVEEATASIDLGASSVSDVVGLPVELREDGTVLVDGTPAEVTMTDDGLVVQGVTVPLNLRRYFPCTPEVDVRQDLVHLACTTDRLPRIVNRILGEVANQA